MKTFLQEARKNPELNPRVSAYQQIIDKGYDTEDYFFTFTHLKKVGIKPTSGHNTPNGIYVYPAKEILPLMYGNMGNVPYANDAPYIHVLKKKGSGIIDPLESYSKASFSKDVNKLFKLFLKNKYIRNDKDIQNLITDIIQQGKDESKLNTPIGWLWNATRYLASDPVVAGFMGWGGVKTGKFRQWYTPGSHITKTKTESGNWKTKRKPKGERVPYHMERSGVTASAQGWNNLLRYLGYEGFIDRSGSGLIHDNEPVQGVFMSKKPFDVVDMIINKSYERLFINSQYEENLKLLKDRGNEVIISDKLDHKQEEIFNELVKGKIWSCKINFFKSSVYIDGEGVAILDGLDLKGEHVHISNATIVGGTYMHLSPVYRCVIEGGDFYNVIIARPEIAGGTFNRCDLRNVGVISNAVLHNTINQLVEVMFYKCEIFDTNMTDCGYTDCTISRSSVSGRKAPVQLSDRHFLSLNDLYNVKISNGKVQKCKIRSSTIIGGEFFGCRFMDTKIFDGKFSNSIVDTDVWINNGVKVE